MTSVKPAHPDVGPSARGRRFPATVRASCNTSRCSPLNVQPR